MLRYKIIVNPTAGRGSGEKAIPDIERLLTAHGLTYDLVRTIRPLHAAELARAAAKEGYDVVVAVGGDGTANEVINGLMEAREAGEGRSALGILGIGRGNDFAFGVSIFPNLEKNCRILANDNRRTIDVGRVTVDGADNPRYFGNGIGIGFDAVVGFEAMKMKRLKGFLCYGVAALKTIFLYFNAPKVKMTFNGESIVQPAIMISVMNGRRMGGGFMMAPEARSDDGLLDLCIAGNPGRMRIFGLILHFLRGTQKGRRHITTDRTRRLSVSALEDVLPAHADGETLCVRGKQLDITICKGALEIVGPPATQSGA